MNGRFPVKVNGQWREAEIDFASEREVKRLAYWRIPRDITDDALLARRIYDAVEFARLASARWRYYHREGSSINSMARLEQVVREHPCREVALVLIARPVCARPSQRSVLRICGGHGAITYLSSFWPRIPR